MKIGDIERWVCGRMGYAELNGMQRAMCGDGSRRLLLTAATGTGKTVAFAIRMLREVAWDGGSRRVGVAGLVVAPSRELVLQVAGVVRRIGMVRDGGEPGVRVVALYGGHDMATEVNEMRGARESGMPVVVVATPGRLVDHLRRGSVGLGGVRCMVIDEYDKSVELGFEAEMRRIVGAVGRGAAMVLTSATEARELPEWMGKGWKGMRNEGSGVVNVPGRVFQTQGCAMSGSEGIADAQPPVTHTLAEARFPSLRTPSGRGMDGNGGVEVVAVKSAERDKLGRLEELLRWMPRGRVIVFVNHRESAERVYGRLRSAGMPVGLYHGGLEQHERRKAVELLANGTTPVVVATDLAARGLDIEGVDAVVHYHLPGEAATWTHRNGRTARQGRPGTVYAILSEGESLPEGVEADRELEGALAANSEGISREWESLYINAGKKEKISKGDVAGYVMQQGGLGREEVGRIAVDDHYAIVAVAAGKGDAVARRLAGVKIKGRRVKVSQLE
ncbi:MAG: DEAD/DEAH box helicase [Bacteroidales bacterium]|nr:DEAD/DEAH box helicase [Bacteroidales bacterium]